MSLFVTLADDRKTEIAHTWCRFVCLSFDTGEVQNLQIPEDEPPVTQDIPSPASPRTIKFTA